MCFTPKISILTAIFEFAVALFILFYYKKSRIHKTAALFIFLLGLYQFTEYMLCTSIHSVFWAKLGFITYTFLPAIGLILCLKNVKKSFNYLAIVAIPIILSLIAISKKGFITEATCKSYFIVIKHLFFDAQNLLLPFLYAVYYFGFILFTSYLLVWHYKKTRENKEKKIDLSLLAGIFISLVPAAFLLFIFPTISLQFPSIYCQFAVIFTILVLISLQLERRINKPHHNKS